jgi:1,2-diacylglycerol 3-beta-galactosyltransferase
VTAFPAERVLLLHTATGNGHRSVAQAVRESIARASNAKCWELEVFAEVRPPLIGRWPSVYSLLSTRSVWLYNLTFRVTDSYWINAAMCDAIYRLAKPSIRAILLDTDPDVVVATAPFVAQVAVRARSDLQAKFRIVNVVSDLVTPHASWVCREADVTAVCSPFAKIQLLKLGMRDENIHEIILPVQSDFYEGSTRKDQRRELGLDVARFTITLSGGGLGSGPVLSCAKALNRAFPEAQLLIVAGHNRRLYELLRSRFRGDRHKVYSFTAQMPALLRACDVVVSKAGPSSIMEACAAGRPVVVIGEIGIQEKGNGNLIQRLGIGYNAENISEMIAVVRSLEHQLEVTGEEGQHPYNADSREIARLVLG